VSTALAIEEYLATSYRPDVEYLQGRLKAKPEVAWRSCYRQISLR
jgi:hypothetical protein